MISIWLRTVIDVGAESEHGAVTECFLNTEHLVSLQPTQTNNTAFRIVARDVSGEVHVLGEYARRDDREKDWEGLGGRVGGYTESLGDSGSAPDVH
jgi:hypothetical protein